MQSEDLSFTTEQRDGKLELNEGYIVTLKEADNEAVLQIRYYQTSPIQGSVVAHLSSGAIEYIPNTGQREVASGSKIRFNTTTPHTIELYNLHTNLQKMTSKEANQGPFTSKFENIPIPHLSALLNNWKGHQYLLRVEAEPLKQFDLLK